MNKTVVEHKFQIGEKVKIISYGPYKDEEGKVVHIDASWGRDNRNGNPVNYTHVQYTVNINGSPFLCCNERELEKVENEKTRNYVEKHPLTNNEKKQIKNIEQKHLICKDKKSGELLLINPLELNDWNKHSETHYAFDGNYWIDYASPNNKIGE